MYIPCLPHRWDVSPKRAIAIQRELARRVCPEPLRGPVRLVAGVDAAFTKDGARCIAAAVLWDVEAGEVVEERVAERPLRFPYVPGLLSFREAPAALAALRKLRHDPHAIMCDAHGLAHPRRFGLACHVGVICRVPTVGCAKSRLVGEHREPAARRGSRCALRDAGETVGSVLRTRDGVIPVYVSAGHLVDLRSAERLVLRCAIKYRVPEPTRLADGVVGREKLRG
jgi:deoxyribonuclease V